MSIYRRYGEWFPVSERPDGPTALLICAPSADPETPLVTVSWWWPGLGFDLPRYWREAITHWMYLPAPPGA